MPLLIRKDTEIIVHGDGVSSSIDVNVSKLRFDGIAINMLPVTLDASTVAGEEQVSSELNDGTATLTFDPVIPAGETATVALSFGFGSDGE